MTRALTPGQTLSGEDCKLLGADDWVLTPKGPRQVAHVQDDGGLLVVAPDSRDWVCRIRPGLSSFLGRPIDGWIPWSGGENPLPGQMVEIVICTGSKLIQMSDLLIWGSDLPTVIIGWRPALPVEGLDGDDRLLPKAAPPSVPNEGGVERLRSIINRLKDHREAIGAGKKQIAEGGPIPSTAPIWAYLNDLPGVMREIDLAELEIEATFEEYEDRLATLSASGPSGVDDLRTAYWRLHAVLYEIASRAPTEEPDPIDWDCGNSGDIAEMAAALEKWEAAEIARAALFEGRVLADHEPPALSAPGREKGAGNERERTRRDRRTRLCPVPSLHLGVIGAAPPSLPERGEPISVEEAASINELRLESRADGQGHFASIQKRDGRNVLAVLDRVLGTGGAG